VYQSADQAGPLDEGKLLFSGINFWLSVQTPSKEHFKQLIKVSINSRRMVMNTAHRLVRLMVERFFLLKEVRT